MMNGKKKRIAFIVQRYGREVNGGAEYYTMQMAQHLKPYYEVEVLTSKALTYDKWEDYYMTDTEELDSITVRRFGVKRKRNRYIQRLLKILITHFGCNNLQMTALWNKVLGPYVPDLIDYVEAHKDEYDAFIFVTYMYYSAVFGMERVREKAIFVPTAHDEYNIYFKIYENAFHVPRRIVYLTEEEKNFVEGHFHNEDVEHRVSGVGVDLPGHIDADQFRKKYGITGEYIIYAGRVGEDKGCGEMFRFFLRYAKEYRAAESRKNGEKLPQLVVIGKKHMEIPVEENIRYLGFVSDEDKYNGIAGAKFLWLPSQFESLSIAVLEAMALEKPVVVNGKCAVLKGHCAKSGGGLWYEGYEGFADAMKEMDGENYDVYRRKAKAYVDKFYRWDRVVEVWKDLIEGIANGAGGT